MLRLLIPCLIWLSSVRSEGEMQMQMQMQEGMMPEKMGMLEPWMMKPKRGSYHDPCPPIYSHSHAYHQPPIYVKPIVIPKKEVSVQPAPVQYVHQQSYVAPKPAVHYVKPAPVIVKPVIQPKVVIPNYHKPMYSYAPIYQKPIYYSQMYHKPMYEMPKAVYVKKYEAPVPQVMYQKPISYAAPIHYQMPKVVQVHQPQINYVKVAQPMVQPVYAPHPPPVMKPYCP